MGYQALLFCPDEKTARSVTHVLSELEFSVEPCTETFAAVKKLMAAHFDAIVVDCDNEQNATLLFKSARNSASNQASLAVAVVEGQAGVAKAFRIGANLVLTKPINIEQAKGTLRVARGLLRKSEAAKSGAAAAAAAAASAAPAKPPVSSPVAPVPTTASASRPAPTPAARPAWPGPPAAPAPAPVAPEQEPPVARSSSAGITKPPAPATPQVPTKPTTAAPAPAKLATPAAPATPAVSALPALAKPLAKPAATASASFSSGAASAPAPAREARPVSPVEAAPADESPASSAKAADDLFETPAPAAPESASPAYEAPAPSFTFGGNATAEPTGSKKILLGIVAVVLLAVGLYFAWTFYIGHHAQPVNPGPNPQPSSGRSPLTSTPVPAPAPSRPVPPAAAQPKSTVADNTKSAPDSDTSSDTETPSSSAAPSGKGAAAAKPAVAPLVVKGGTVRGMTAKPAVPDAPAPSVIGIAAPSGSGPPPNLVSSSSTARPVLQRLNVSQGVSQGLLIKKIAPAYPASALRLRIEGTVQLLATVSKTGEITEVKVLSGDPQLTHAATDAVKRWKYKPYLLDGEPIEIQTPVTINFTLPH